MDLIERKYRILQAIIDDYIMTALPVGSRTISRKYEQKLSSATIRNEMSDLEELGYLDSPHTSAGRVPSNKAYRLYVDQMLTPMALSPEEQAFIRQCFDRRTHQVEDLSLRIARSLSSMTNYTTAVLTRTPKSDQIFSHLQLVHISSHRALLIIVTRSGAVRQSVVELGGAIAPDELYTVSKILTAQLEGCPLSDLSRRFASIAGGTPGDMQHVMRALSLEAQQASKDEVSALVVGGRSNLLRFPEYADVDKARSLLSVFEARDKVVSLLSGGGEMEFSVRIGPETGLEEMKDCSVVSASFRLDDGRVNTIGLIGPRRMQYGKALAVLSQVGKALGDMLEDGEGGQA